MPSYSYDSTIPQASDDPSVSQGQILTNFGSISSIIAVDHYGFGVANGGYHKQITYPVASDPGSSSGQVVTYGKTANGSSEVFLQRDGVATAIQLTSGTTVTGTNGQSFLPGGVQIKWGVTSVNGSGTVTYTNFGLTAFPNNTLTVFVTGQSNARTYNAGDYTSTGFSVSASSSGGGNFCWLAIGY